ncbi:MAG TPA: hypothetical protein VF317_02760 [Dermatophilaceae bacterium]
MACSTRKPEAAVSLFSRALTLPLTKSTSCSALVALRACATISTSGASGDALARTDAMTSRAGTLADPGGLEGSMLASTLTRATACAKLTVVTSGGRTLAGSTRRNALHE